MGFFNFSSIKSVNADPSGNIYFSLELPVGFPQLLSFNVMSATPGTSVTVLNTGTGYGVDTDGAGTHRFFFSGISSVPSAPVSLSIVYLSASSDEECTTVGYYNTFSGGYGFVGS